MQQAEYRLFSIILLAIHHPSLFSERTRNDAVCQMENTHGQYMYDVLYPLQFRLQYLFILSHDVVVSRRNVYFDKFSRKPFDFY